MSNELIAAEKVNKVLFKNKNLLLAACGWELDKIAKRHQSYQEFCSVSVNEEMLMAMNEVLNE